MATIEYALGPTDTLDQLFPPAKYVDNPVKNWKGDDVTLETRPDVIRHYTENSLAADLFTGFTVSVREADGAYRVRIDAEGDESRLALFAGQHRKIFGSDGAAKAIVGRELLEELGVWNPMSGYPVNNNKHDGLCTWTLFPPLGLNVIGQKGILLMHYPPWETVQRATFLDVMTMNRWNTLLNAAVYPKKGLEVSPYRTIVDVNPIAAPGSGQSEYENDYFPTMMASGFFTGPPERDYIRSMLEIFLDPPGHEDGEYTLPLLICGSHTYDPQAPLWVRTTYKDQMPQRQPPNVDGKGIPDLDVLQTGTIRIRPDSPKQTPYMCANHQIAAGVMGKCTDTPSSQPDMRLFEAQDLVAASFLLSYGENPHQDPAAVKAEACLRWFGNREGTGIPKPPAKQDAQILCALAQMDLFFEPTPWPHPKYTFEKAMERCADANNGFDPCAPPIGPGDDRRG